MVRVLLELDPGDMLSGRFRGPAGEVEPFRGWLDLAGRLERARPGRSLTPDENPPNATGVLSKAGERPSLTGTPDRAIS
jgi:hypothetical protein